MLKRNSPFSIAISAILSSWPPGAPTNIPAIAGVPAPETSNHHARFRAGSSAVMSQRPVKSLSAEKEREEKSRKNAMPKRRIDLNLSQQSKATVLEEMAEIFVTSDQRHVVIDADLSDQSVGQLGFQALGQ